LQIQQKNDAQLLAIALLEEPDTRAIALGRGPGGTGESATIVYHPSTRRAVVVGNGLKPPSGKDYELWVIKGEEKIPAGIVSSARDGRISMTLDAAALAKGVDAFAITLEAAGGAPQPLGPIVLVSEV
jgi:anti-sigma-K factor RskA